MEKRITIKCLKDIDIAYSLGYLSNFPRGSYFGRTNNIWHKALSEKCVIGIHEDTLKKTNLNIIEAVTYFGPDIIVSSIFNSKDEYLINFNEKLVKEDLLDKIQEKDMSVYFDSKR